MKGECSAARGAHEDAFAMATQGHTSTVDARRLGHGLGVHVVNLDDDREEDETLRNSCADIAVHTLFTFL